MTSLEPAREAVLGLVPQRAVLQPDFEKLSLGRLSLMKGRGGRDGEQLLHMNLDSAKNQGAKYSPHIS